MKRIKFISIIFTVFMLFAPISAYSNGDTVEIPSGGMDSTGAIFKFSLPQGDYPADSKLVIYAQKDVLCPFPGYTPEAPTADKNPYTLLAEYNFSTSDISNLKNGETQFQVTTKFDPECGDMYARIVGGSDQVKDNDNSTIERPSGESSDNNVELTKYTDGMQVDATFEIVGTTLFFTVPQGSFTLADYFVIIDGDKKVVASIIISETMMNSLADGSVEFSHALQSGLNAADLSMIVSDTSYTVGTQLDVDVEPIEKPDIEPNDDENTSNNSLSPLFVGLGVFVLVLAIGFAASHLEKLKKQKQNASTSEKK